MQHFNKLAPAEAERLALLSEECAEVIQIVCKIQRHGYDSYNPNDENETPNRNLLEKEVGHVRNSIGLMTIQGDLSPRNINYHSAEKSTKIGKYLHHQSGK